MSSEACRRTPARRNKIAPSGVFYLLFLSRISALFVALPQGVTKELALGALVSVPLTLLVCVPIIICAEKNKNPLDFKWVSRLYSAFFTFVAGVNALCFSTFCSEHLRDYSKGWLFALGLTVAACYCAYLGLEGITRFSAFAFLIFSGALVLLCVLNLSEAEVVRLLPYGVSLGGTVKSAAMFTSTFAEPAVFLCISRSVNGRARGALVSFVTVASAVAAVLYLFALAVLGRGVGYFNYPLFTLMQSATIGGFERLDVLFTSLVTFGIFLRSLLFIYCGARCLELKNKKASLIAVGLVSAVMALVFSRFESSGASAVLFVIFCVVIPLLALIKRR